MRRRIVEDHLDCGPGRRGGIEEFEEFDELAAAMALHDEGVDFAGDKVNPNQQRQRAMALAMELIARGLTSAVLSDCHLGVSAGEIVTLRGASGSGKTLLLRAIADLDPHEGEVSLGGVARSAMSGPQWRRRVRFVAAEAAWWADRVGEHFRAPDTAAAMALDVGIAAACMDWAVARLSTGEKQRLGFLRAVEDRPEVLLLDEPTAALDKTAEQAVEMLIRRLQADGAAIVLVTHSDSQAARLAVRRYVIEGGRLREAP